MRQATNQTQPGCVSHSPKVQESQKQPLRARPGLARQLSITDGTGQVWAKPRHLEIAPLRKALTTLFPSLSLVAGT